MRKKEGKRERIGEGKRETIWEWCLGKEGGERLDNWGKREYESGVDLLPGWGQGGEESKRLEMSKRERKKK